MKKAYLFAALASLMVLGGCLKFGDDIETTKPTAAQIKRCTSEMYLDSSMKITTLGFKLIGSGMDDHIWFKFKTDATDVSEIFVKAVVDVAKFSQKVSWTNMADQPKWWDTKGKNLLGGQVSLPNARYMNVGIERTQDGYVVYVEWFET